MGSEKTKERNETIDVVAQAVLDRLAERCEVIVLANQVAQRVRALQAEEAALKQLNDRTTEPLASARSEVPDAASGS